jgi:hypothetical protein
VGPGIAADMDSYSGGYRLGFLNPLLYDLLDSSHSSEYFNDITGVRPDHHVRWLVPSRSRVASTR